MVKCFQIAIGCVLVSTIVLNQADAQDLATPTPELAQILAQWRTNEERFHSLRCTWDETRIYLSGSVIPSGVPGYGGIPDDSPIVGTGWPVSEIAIKGPHLLMLSGVMMRNEEIMLGLPSDGGEGFRTSRHLSSFDGETSVSAGISPDSTGSQVKRIGTSSPDRLSLTWVPIRNIVRPLDPNFQARSTTSLTCQLIDENTAIVRDANGMDCHVDMRNDCIITRASQKHPQKGSLLWEYDLTFARNSENVCVPKAWTLREWVGDNIAKTQTAEVTQFSYGEQLAKADFQLQLPGSLELFDQRAGVTGDHGHVRTPTPIATSQGTLSYFLLMILFCGVLTVVVWQRYLRRGHR